MSNLDPVFLSPDDYATCTRCSGNGRETYATQCSSCQGLGRVRIRRRSPRSATAGPSVSLEKFPESYTEALRKAEQKRLELIQEVDSEMLKLRVWPDSTYEPCPSTIGEYLNNLRLVVSKMDPKKGLGEFENRILDSFQKWPRLYSKISAFQLACLDCLITHTEEEFPILKKNRELGNKR